MALPSVSAVQAARPALARGPAFQGPAVGTIPLQHGRRRRSRQQDEHSGVEKQRQRQRPGRRPSAAAAEGEAAPPDEAPTAAAQPWISPASLRKVTAAVDANEALDVLAAECAAGGASITADALSEAHCLELMMACLERGNSALALSIIRAMSAAVVTAGVPASPTGSLLSLSSMDGGDAAAGGAAPRLRWPRASVQAAASLVVGLTRVLETRAAISLINSVRARGLASTEDVCFGHVVRCPQDRWVLKNGRMVTRRSAYRQSPGLPPLRHLLQCHGHSAY